MAVQPRRWGVLEEGGRFHSIMGGISGVQLYDYGNTREVKRRVTGR